MTFFFSIYIVVIQFTGHLSHNNLKIIIVQSDTDCDQDYIGLILHSVTCSELVRLLLLQSKVDFYHILFVVACCLLFLSCHKFSCSALSFLSRLYPVMPVLSLYVSCVTCDPDSLCSITFLESTFETSPSFLSSVTNVF